MASLWFVLSPCGTSLLTNRSTDDERKLVIKFANEKSKEDVPEVQRSALEARIAAVHTSLEQASEAEAARLSAEINGVTKLYREAGRQDRGKDVHQLLCTDTWLGQETANLVKFWLERQGFTVQVHRQKDLRTVDLVEFQSALSDLAHWAAETLPGYRQQQYRVVFNLTGGFKSVQGFLQTLAMFHADETVYVFETGDALLRIPRLPVRLEVQEPVRMYLQVFRRLGRQLDVSAQAVEGVPETLLLKLGGEVALSAWGELVWSGVKPQLYREQVWPSPSKRLVYGPQFGKSVEKLEKDRVVLVNERIDQLVRYLESGGAYNPTSLDFKPVRGKSMLPSTHEADAWADKDAQRFYGHEEQGTFVLDRLGPALH